MNRIYLFCIVLLLLLPLGAFSGVRLESNGAAAVLDNGVVTARVELLRSMSRTAAVTALGNGHTDARFVRGLEDSLGWADGAVLRPVAGLPGPAVEIVGETRFGKRAARLFILPRGSRAVVTAIVAEAGLPLSVTSSWNEGFANLENGTQHWVLRDLFSYGPDGRRLLGGTSAVLASDRLRESVAWSDPDGGKTVSMFSWGRMGPRPLRVTVSSPGSQDKPTRLVASIGDETKRPGWPQGWDPDLSKITLTPKPKPDDPQVVVSGPREIVPVGGELTITASIAAPTEQGDVLRWTIEHPWENREYSHSDAVLEPGAKSARLTMMVRHAIINVRADLVRAGKVVATGESLVNTGTTMDKPILMGPQHTDIQWPAPPKGTDWGNFLFIGQMNEGGDAAEGLRMPEYARVLLKCGADTSSFSGPRGNGYGPADDEGGSVDGGCDPLGAEWLRMTQEPLVLCFFEQWQSTDETGHLIDDFGRDAGMGYRQRCQNNPRTLANYVWALRRLAKSFGPAMVKFNGKWVIDWMEEGEGHWSQSSMTCYCDFCRNRFREWLWDKYSDDSPDKDTNRDGHTLNSDCGTSFANWQSVQPPLMRERDRLPRLWIYWCRFRTDSMMYTQSDLPHYYGFENFVCAGGWPAMQPNWCLPTAGNIAEKSSRNDLLGYDSFDCMDTSDCSFTIAGVWTRYLRKYPEKKFVWIGPYYSGGWRGIKAWDANFWNRLTANQWGRIGRFGATPNSLWWDNLVEPMGIIEIHSPSKIEEVSWMSHTLEGQHWFLDKLLPVKTSLAVYFPWESYMIEPYLAQKPDGDFKDGSKAWADGGIGYVLAHSGYNFDVLYPEDIAKGALTDYSTLVVPSGPWMDDGVSEAIKEFRRRGGKVVLLGDALSKNLDGTDPDLREGCTILEGNLVKGVLDGDKTGDLPPLDGSVRNTPDMTPVFTKASRQLAASIGSAGREVTVTSESGEGVPNVVLGAQSDKTGERYLITLTENRGVATRVRVRLPEQANGCRVLDMKQAAMVGKVSGGSFSVDIPHGGVRLLLIATANEAAKLVALQKSINKEAQVFEWHCSRHFFIDIPDKTMGDAFAATADHLLPRAVIVIPDKPGPEDKRFAEVMQTAILDWPVGPGSPTIPICRPRDVTRDQIEHMNLLLVGSPRENSLLARLVKSGKVPDPGTKPIASNDVRPYWFGGNTVVIQGGRNGERLGAFSDFYHWFVMYFGGRADYHPADITYSSAAANLSKLKEKIALRAKRRAARVDRVAPADTIISTTKATEGWKPSLPAASVGKTSAASATHGDALVLQGDPSANWNGCVLSRQFDLPCEGNAGKCVNLQLLAMIPQGAHATRYAADIRLLGSSSGPITLWGHGQSPAKGVWDAYDATLDLPIDATWQSAVLDMYIQDDDNGARSGGPVVLGDLYIGIEDGSNLLTGTGCRGY